MEALEQLFNAVPEQLPAALVVITHLGPHRETLLAEIISRHTRMPVVNATHGARVQAGHIYVLPSEHVLTMRGAELQLQRVEEGHRERNPIDVFFSSIAKQWGEHSVGVVLSGAGTDGTLGVKAIKEEGGLTIAQGTASADRRTTACHRAPWPADSSTWCCRSRRSAQSCSNTSTACMLSTRCWASDDRRRAERRDGALREIHAILRKRVGHDFRSYKEKTFLRRVHRRMQVRQVAALPDYLDLLQQDADESAAAVSRSADRRHCLFPRRARRSRRSSPKSYRELFERRGRQRHDPRLGAGMRDGRGGLLDRAAVARAHEQLDVVPKVQVFATDIDEPALSWLAPAAIPLRCWTTSRRNG